jgi:hypothetical protein
MKIATINKSLMTMLFLFAFGHAGSVLAARVLGTLGSGASAIDYGQITCSSNSAGVPARLEIQVKDMTAGAAPRVSVQVQKDLLAASATDETDNDANMSPVATVNGGAGTYNIFINKSGTGAESYGLEVYCKTSAGVETGITGNGGQLQNQ